MLEVFRKVKSNLAEKFVGELKPVRSEVVIKLCIWCIAAVCKFAVFSSKCLKVKNYLLRTKDRLCMIRDLDVFFDVLGNLLEFNEK